MANESDDHRARSPGRNSQLLERKWLELTYNSVGDCLFLLSVEPDENYRFVSLNEAFLRVTGLTREQVIGKNIRDVIPPQAQALVFGKYHKALGENKTVSWEEESVYPTGKRVGEVKISPLTDEATGQIYLVGVVHDITERKLAEEALRQSEAELRALFAAMNDLIFVIDKEGRHLKVALTAPEKLYRSSDAIIDKTLHEIFPEPTANLFHDYINQALATHSPVSIEYNLDIGGHEKWFVANIAPMTEETVVWVARDITDIKLAERSLRESEHLYRETVENANDIIYTLDLQGRYISANRAGESITGYTRDEIRRMNFTDLIAPEYLDVVLEKMGNKVESGGQTFYEVEIITKDRRRIMVEINSRLLERNGVPIGVLGIARDITERKRSEEKLGEIEEQLRQSQKLESIGQLAGGIAHDFNNMLTAINGYSDLILRKLGADDPLRHMAEEIRKAGDRASGLTHQLLAFSRKQILQPKTLNINDIVSDVSRMLQRLIGEDIDLKAILNERLGQVEADPGQITQVLLNLAVNARDAMPSGGKLTIETDNVNLNETYTSRHVGVTPGRYVMLAVSDTGVGMDEDTLNHIFEPFFTTKAVGEGTGMGLATVYGVVKQSRGNIWAYSEKGLGTTFKIYLPLIDKEAESIEAETLKTDLPTGTETILLVEDEEMVRALSKQILETCGYTVIEAVNGADALRLCEETGCDADLLVTDVVMPQMGGRELVLRLAETRPALRALYISGYTDKAIVHHGILNEDINFIQKPFTPEDFARKVRDVLDAS
ncbi:MAG: PAS domain S-box protein [Pyrinomonadaceae bacterium]